MNSNSIVFFSSSSSKNFKFEFNKFFGFNIQHGSTWLSSFGFNMAQQRVPSEDEITNMITSWDTDDELSSDEENVKTPLGFSHSSPAQSRFIASDCGENELDDDSNRCYKYRSTKQYFVRYNWQKWYNLDVLST